MNAPRRDAAGLVLAHRMDPDRIELIVEGKADRAFIEWLTEPTRSPNAMVREIASVELPNVDVGGERGRLIQLAEVLEQQDCRIRFLADADYDRILSVEPPGNVWLTDHRDVEGYFFRLECIDKLLAIGVVTSRVAAQDVLTDATRIGRRVGLTRIASHADDLQLPFQGTSLWRHLTAVQGRVEYRETNYISALLQNAEISLSGRSDLVATIDALEITYASTRDSELVHGKDAETVLAKALKCFGVAKDDSRRLLWTSYERRLADDEPVLGEIGAFLAG